MITTTTILISIQQFIPRINWLDDGWAGGGRESRQRPSRALSWRVFLFGNTLLESVPKFYSTRGGVQRNQGYGLRDSSNRKLIDGGSNCGTCETSKSPLLFTDLTNPVLQAPRIMCRSRLETTTTTTTTTTTIITVIMITAQCIL